MTRDHAVQVRGSVWYVSPHWGCGPGVGDGPFHGLADPPRVQLVCAFRSAKGLRNRFGNDTSMAYLVVTDTPIAPQVGEAWTIEPAELDDNFHAGPHRVRLVRVLATHEGRWGLVQECLIAVSGPGSPLPMLNPVPVRP